MATATLTTEMSDLPPPPAPPPSPAPLPSPPASEVDAPRPARHPRPGELTPTWRLVVIATWTGVVLGLASVWKTSRTLGLSTWWLGPSSDPHSIVVQIAPFVVPIALVIAASRHARWLPAWGAAGSMVLGAVAVGDLGGFDRLAVVELVIAGSALAVSIASSSGMLRRR